jgi:NAD(P)-dependent dehydrogenase (short-subunit alcohol dehydrogenase family)
MRTRAVLITGASSGIGEATARLFAGKGFRTFAGFRSEEDGARLGAAGLDPVRLDVTDGASVDAAADRVRTGLGTGGVLTALVNNAGVPSAGPLELMPEEEIRRVMEVNLFGALRVSRTFLPLLRASGGRIVNVSSVSGLRVYPFLGAYAASKHALEAISDAFRRELIPFGVDVVVVEPGPIRTPIWDRPEIRDVQTYAGTDYETVLRRVRETALRGAARGLPAERVAEAIHRAVTLRRPPARIPVVRSRLRFHLSRLLPDRWIDRLVARFLYR